MDEEIKDEEIKAISDIDGHTVSEVVNVGAKLMLRLSAPARKVIYAIEDGELTEEEVARIVRLVDRCLIIASDKVVMQQIYQQDINTDSKP